MSTSLKVVSMAAVFCASFRRRAMVWRSRVIVHALFARGVIGGGRRAHLHAAAAVEATGVGCAAARSIAAIMSPLVTWPSLPEPATLARIDAAFGGQFAHRRRRRHSPAGAAAPEPGAGFGGSARFGGGASRAAPRLRPRRRAGAFLDLAEQRADADGLAVLDGNRPTATPAAGAGTSSVTLSVSSSTSGSSTATASPGFLNHLPTVASVTDSPSVGTRISAMSAPSPQRSLYAWP